MDVLNPYLQAHDRSRPAWPQALYYLHDLHENETGRLKGGTVTDPRNDVRFVATEHGGVVIKGLSLPQWTRGLIGLAAPEFREGLQATN